MLDIEDLTEPIAGDSPAGPDLRLDPGDLTFQTLKDYTTVVDASVAETESEVREPNWSGVESLCYSALREKSKDLEIAAALAQAWAQTEGAAGARQGLDLFEQLLERFWDGLHPGVDPDDDSITLPLRARWLNWLDAPNGFIKAVKQGPLLRSQSGGTFSWQDHENSALLDDATLSAERRQELVETGIVGEGEWSTALGQMDAAALGDITVHLTRAGEVAASLAAFCSERFEDDDAPDFYNLRNALEEMRDYFGRYAGDAVGEASVAEPTAQGAAPTVAAAASGPIATREDALRALQQVGDYFRRAEPHSPISYLIDRAVRWGGMPLEKLLRDVVRNDDVIEHIWETLGLDARGGGSSDDRNEEDED